MDFHAKMSICGLLGAFSLVMLVRVANEAFAVSQPLSAPVVTERLRLYQDIVSLNASFKQVKKVKGLGMELSSDGEFTILRPSRVVWHVIHPSRLVVTLEKDNIRMETGEGKDKRVDSLALSQAKGAAESLTNLVAWLQLDVPAILERYVIFDEGNNWYRCEPKQLEKSPFQRIRLGVHPQGHLQQLVLDEKSGDTIEIRFGRPTIVRKK